MHKQLLGALVCCFLMGVTSSWASSYPTKNIKVVVPFAAGGMTDILARQFAKKLSEQTAKPVIVENKTGAGGIIGAEYVAKSKNDGHTLMVTTTAHVVNPAINNQLPYNTEEDFSPIAMLARTPMVLMVNHQFPANTIEGFIKYSKEKEPVTYGSAGAGGLTHMSGELLALKTGANLTHIPYKGTALAVNDLLGGHIDASFVDALTASNYLKNGQLKPLGVTTSYVLEDYPTIPTISSELNNDYETEIWIGLYAPKGVDEAILNRLNQIAREAMSEPEFLKMIKSQGTTPGDMETKDFGLFVNQEIGKWKSVVGN